MGEKTLEYLKKWLSKISVENIKLELMRTAYGTRDTFLAGIDPRILIIWYFIFAVVPWFFYNNILLLALFIFVVLIVSFSRVSKLIIFLLAFGVTSEMVFYGLMANFLGGGTEAFIALITLTLKLVIISLASIAVFASMDPEKLGDAFLSFGLSGRVTFGISYGYRMLPILIEEYHNIINAYRLRGKSPANKGFLYWNYIFYIGKIMINAFYPLIFNSAKRTRTTVEALELKGFSYALEQEESKKLKLSYLKIRAKDMIFLLFSLIYVLFIFYLGFFL